MRRERVPYGPAELEVEVPDQTRVVDATVPIGLPPAPDPASDLRQALASPLGLPPLSTLVRRGSRVFLAFDDPCSATRQPVRHLLLQEVVGHLLEAGVRLGDITFHCANALHRRWRREELAATIGPDLVERFGDRLRCHDAEEPGGFLYLGTTPNGYEVEVRREVAENDLTVYVNRGSTGFSGGWKSVIIGLGTWRSIRATHHPDGMSMSVRHNRFHQVLNEMGEHLERRLGKRIFKVETLLADQSHIARVWAGGVAETRQAALEVLQALVPPRRGQVAPADVVLYGVPDWSPYATLAGLNPILTLVSTGLGYLGGYIEAVGKPGCSVILATPCPEEWDMEHHPSYKVAWDQVLPQTRDAYEVHRRFAEEFAGRQDLIERYRFGYAYHPVHAILAIHPLKRLRHAGRVFVAGAMDPAVPRHLGFIPVPTVEEALAEAHRIHGPDPSIVLVRTGRPY